MNSVLRWAARCPGSWCGVWTILAVACSVPRWTSAQDNAALRDLAEGEAYISAGRYAEAIAFFEQVTKAQPRHALAWARLARSLLEAGEIDRAADVAARARDFPETRVRGWYILGLIHMERGQPDKALAAIERAVKHGFALPGLLEQEPRFHALQDNPRFVALLKQVRAGPTDADYAMMDFWIGEWDVYDRGGTRVGTNKLEKLENGLIIMEHWVDGAGGTGKSMNYFDPAAKLWKQVWVSRSAVIEMSGTLRDGAMKFTGRTMLRSGATADHRTTLTALSGGRVRQLIEDSTDGGKTWRVGVDYLYFPKGESYQPLESIQPSE